MTDPTEDINPTGTDGTEAHSGASQPEPVANPFAKPADCDYPGSPTVMDGKCMCLVCARCGHHTGNGYTGHNWSYCNVTQTEREHHFCCPGDCELESQGVSQ